MDECETPAEFTNDERAFLETYAMLLRLLFAPRTVTTTTTTTKQGEAA